MNLKELVEKIHATLTSPDFKEVCDEYGGQMMAIYRAYQNGEETAVLPFLSHWIPWLLGSDVVTTETLGEVDPKLKRDLHIVDQDTEQYFSKELKEGRWIVLGGVTVRGVNSARIYAYEDAEVTLYDEAVCYAYDTATVKAKSGWVYAFNSAQVYFSGKGIAELFDSSFIVARGYVMVFAYDLSTVTSNLRVHLIDKRANKSHQPDASV